MLHTRNDLELFHQLLKLNFPYELSAGLRIGRGFADAGFEEYSALATNRAVSLSTGKIIDLDEFYQNYYFPILTVDQISRELYERDWNLEEITFVDQRDWQITVTRNDQTMTFQAKSLLTCYTKALLEVLVRIQNV